MKKSKEPIFSAGLALFICGVASAQALPPKTWDQLARNVGAAEKNRKQVLEEMRKIPQLPQILISNLDTPLRPLALDAIAAINDENLLPLLLEKVETDRDGFLVLTVNSMMTAKNKVQIAQHYLRVFKKMRFKGFFGGLFSKLAPGISAPGGDPEKVGLRHQHWWPCLNPSIDFLWKFLWRF